MLRTAKGICMKSNEPQFFLSVPHQAAQQCSGRSCLVPQSQVWVCAVACASGRQRNSSHLTLLFVLLTGRKKHPSPHLPSNTSVPCRHKPNPGEGQKPSSDPASPSALQVLERSLERSKLFLMLQQKKKKKNTTKLNIMVCERLLGVWGHHPATAEGTTTNPDILLPTWPFTRKESRKGM